MAVIISIHLDKHYVLVAYVFLNLVKRFSIKHFRLSFTLLLAIGYNLDIIVCVVLLLVVHYHIDDKFILKLFLVVMPL